MGCRFGIIFFCPLLLQQLLGGQASASLLAGLTTAPFCLSAAFVWLNSRHSRATGELLHLHLHLTSSRPQGSLLHVQAQGLAQSCRRSPVFAAHHFLTGREADTPASEASICLPCKEPVQSGPAAHPGEEAWVRCCFMGVTMRGFMQQCDVRSVATFISTAVKRVQDVTWLGSGRTPHQPGWLEGCNSCLVLLPPAQLLPHAHHNPSDADLAGILWVYWGCCSGIPHSTQSTWPWQSLGSRRLWD